MRKQKILTVFVDLDSTLADTRQRHALIDEDDRERTDWIRYALACANDVPVPGVVRLVEMLALAGYFVVILSGRAHEASSLTIEWLRRHSIPYHDLLMRGPNQHGTPAEFKVRQLLAWMQGHPDHEPMLVIDDWPDVRDLMEAIKIPTLLVSPPIVEKPMFEYDEGVELTQNE